MKNPGAGRPSAEEYAKRNACPNCGYIPPYQAKSPPRGAVKYRGVSKARSKYSARLMVAGKMLNLGYFDKPEDAAKAYDEAVIKFLGVQATTNFPKTLLALRK